MMQFAKTKTKSVLMRSRALQLARRFGPYRIVILRYHSVRDELYAGVNVIPSSIVRSTEIFAGQMELIARHYSPVTMDDIVACLHGGRSLPKNAVAVTFDDGYTDNCDIAAPILDRVGFPAAFYVMLDSIGTDAPPWYCRTLRAFSHTKLLQWYDAEDNVTRPLRNAVERREARLIANRRCASRIGSSQRQTVARIENELQVEPFSSSPGLMMDWEHVRCLRDRGHLIGSHTLSHPNLALLEPDNVMTELTDSKSLLEAKLAQSVIHFSYPNPIVQPHWTENTRAALQQVGYETAVTSSDGAVTQKDNPFSLQRIAVAADLFSFQWKLEAAFLGRVA